MVVSFSFFFFAAHTPTNENVLGKDRNNNPGDKKCTVAQLRIY